MSAQVDQQTGIEPECGPQQGISKTTHKWVIRGRNYEGEIHEWSFADDEEDQARLMLQDLKTMHGKHEQYAMASLALVRQTIRSQINEEWA